MVGAEIQPVAFSVQKGEFFISVFDPKMKLFQNMIQGKHPFVPIGRKLLIDLIPEPFKLGRAALFL